MDKTGLDKLKAGDQVYLISGIGAERTVPRIELVERVTETQIMVKGTRFYRKAPKNVHYGADRFIGREIGERALSLRGFIFPVTDANTKEAEERRNQYDLDLAAKVIVENMRNSTFRKADWDTIHRLCDLLPDLRESRRIRDLLSRHPRAEPEVTEAERRVMQRMEAEQAILTDFLNHINELGNMVTSLETKIHTQSSEGAIPRPATVVHAGVNSVDNGKISGVNDAWIQGAIKLGYHRTQNMKGDYQAVIPSDAVLCQCCFRPSMYVMGFESDQGPLYSLCLDCAGLLEGKSHFVSHDTASAEAPEPQWQPSEADALDELTQQMREDGTLRSDARID